ncbi:NUDIX hydrolase [Pseudalkalibacillus berkeleyi]|uniref:NUDIX domain-containing protein n=1 Tax=Pseudalkalibacillus berkeleyi TaxID=1069813 RepID=A0ABS9GYY3_9BACL|nr:NUDIX domain-containing protein [Pseudalkalibacillus berkeleyi]MCF6136859.1 NUDIX domain-containing protein [Pseudalkalibacillus berkeleyi]
MRNSSRVALFHNRSIALMKRFNNGEEYYVFPGGGIENDEDPKETAIREAKEELGVEIKVNDLIHVEHWNGLHHFYTAHILGGEFGTGLGEEFSSSKRGLYQPIWYEIDLLSEIDLRPKSMLTKLQSINKNSHP